MQDFFQVKVGGTLVDHLAIERQEGVLNLVVIDPRFGKFNVGNLVLEISKDASSWVQVNTHELIALLMTGK